ncbi:hypothetical protein [Mycetocola sp.]|uniref:hypothetical protein n=1 Tax=Mycetocola sp. TaxID=1871042 RepID=UPI00345C1196
MHLRVGGLERAREFCRETLGFAVTAETHGALLFAAGGYHHVAANTWSSAGSAGRNRSGSAASPSTSVRRMPSPLSPIG